MRRCVLMLAVLVTSCDTPTQPQPPSTFFSPVTVLPNPVAMRVGATAQLTAYHLGTALEQRLVAWTSSSSGVASVGASTGLVQCLAPGSTTITADPGSRPNAAAGSATVTCNSFTLPSDPLLFTHVIGTSPCPQPVGTIRVTNTSDETLTVVVTSLNPALQTDVSFVTLPARGARDVQVIFNCGTQVSFRSAIAFSAVFGGITDEKQVTVVATITR